MPELTNAERRELEALRAAARKFIAKVDARQAHSILTYAELKEALAIGERVCVSATHPARTAAQN